MARQFQLLSCDIALGGDMLNVVAKGEFDAVTYPELLILRVLHGGEQWITNIFDVGHIEREDADERKRLSEKYGAEVVKGIFSGGAYQTLPNGDNRFAPKPVPVIAKPQEVEQPKPVLRNQQLGGQPVPPPAAAEPGPDSASTTPIMYGGVAEQTHYVPVVESEVVDPTPTAEGPVAGTDVAPPKSRRPVPVSG